MNDTFPLIRAYRADTPLLRTPTGHRLQAQFLSACHALAQRLPPAQFVINLCEDRGAFMHAFAAVVWNGQTNLLPPSRAPGVVHAVAATYPDSYLLCDAPFDDIGVPQYLLPSAVPEASPWTGEVPQIPATHAAAIAFTSGSTGGPQPHVKSWRMLMAGAQLYVDRLLGHVVHNVVATVPPQHMYGLELSVLTALAGGCRVHAARPVFPEDVRAALEQMDAPRLLVTTPVHLRALLASGIRFPPIARVVSATAPLSRQLASQVEARLSTQVYEIYGCTEAGSMCTRRTVEGERWQPFPGLRMVHHEGVTHVSGPHLDAPVSTPDVIEVNEDGTITLLGRTADMIKVAGKRASLTELTGKLLGVPGVEDGVVFLPPTARGEPRPAALVVAPGLSEPEILEALRREMDPVFLPRPLRKVERLPRNELGKLPREQLLALLGRA
jgi:acyl-coenzyme A synthetase/AMP-(fatty) acid ligase